MGHAAGRRRFCRARMAVCVAAVRPRLRAHHLEPCADTLQGLRDRDVRAADHVDLLRLQDSHRMTPAARLSAAIEVLADIEARRRPAAQALKDWGLSHRFAGSGDRAAIAGLTYDALRRRASAAWIMGADTPRAVLLGMLRHERGLEPDAIAKLCDGGGLARAPPHGDE